ncbi:MAG TPA: hypothetical protein VII11_00300 [Bacteroidota bacterium]
MDIFCHINDLGRSGYNSLRTLVIAFDHVVLWSPSERYLQKLCESDPLLPAPEELLWYCEQGHVKIMGRDWWLTNEEPRKKHPWRYAKWSDSFDGRILEFLREDRLAGRSGSNARVIQMGPEDGDRWAEEQLRLGHVNAREINLATEKNRTLAAYRRRFQQARQKTNPAQFLLRVARNHGVAIAASGADRNFGTPTDKVLFQTLTNAAFENVNHVFKLQSTKVSGERLAEALDAVISKIQTAGKAARSKEEAFDRVTAILSDKNELEDIRKWVNTADLLAAQIGEIHVEGILSENLVKTIAQGALRKTLSDYILPGSTADKVATISSLILGGVGMTLGSPLAPIGLGILALTRGINLLKWASVIPDDYTGPNWPFYLAEGDRAVTRIKRENLLRVLQR